jgi:hypothetical protein
MDTSLKVDSSIGISRKLDFAWPNFVDTEKNIEIFDREGLDSAPHCCNSRLCMAIPKTHGTYSFRLIISEVFASRKTR